MAIFIPIHFLGSEEKGQKLFLNQLYDDYPQLKLDGKMAYSRVLCFKPLQVLLLQHY